ncbi:hypothetical protein SLEP1_g22141 [Rubroshorea leprosula]|uniref:HD-ZIP protein N-terminal domain-containing protein n=1 Tax=Rubroshorea leprosula TaxID=152421 RepID=A0AAV5JHJ0_9ROSI|nr:hypothetical protein SLEP1_g22141 [Rubroshorea leprosula]
MRENMIVEKEVLGLSLSLSFPQNPSLHLNLSSSSPSGLTLQKPVWNDATHGSDLNSESSRPEMKSFLRGIDVNRLPSTADCDEEAGVSSPNSTISSVSGKRSERDGGEEHELDRASSRGISDEEDGDTSRKKLRLSKDQSAILEESFKEHNTLNPVTVFVTRFTHYFQMGDASRIRGFPSLLRAKGGVELRLSPILGDSPGSKNSSSAFPISGKFSHFPISSIIHHTATVSAAFLPSDQPSSALIWSWFLPEIAIL